MKQKITPTNKEIRLNEGHLIVSKTDTKGRITYANRDFMNISGFAEPELLGVQHNVVRHPDMPRGVYKLMWDTLQSGEEFFGYVKNLCKDGSFYWVLANVTPDRDPQGQLRGFYSVRRRPSPQGLSSIMPVYQHMLELERHASGKDAIARSTAYLNELLQSRQTTYTGFMLDLIKGDLS